MVNDGRHISEEDELFKQGYNVIFLAIGAHQNKLGVEGEDRPGVIGGVPFLRQVTLL